MEDNSNQNSGEEEWSKVKYGGHHQDEARSATAIGVKGDVPATFTLEDENEGMDWNVQQVFGMEELVSNILSYLPTCDIQSCNGVSSLWRQEARKLLLKRTRMDFGGEGRDVLLQVDSYIEEMGDNCHPSIRIHSLKDKNLTQMAKNLFGILKLGNKYGCEIQKLYLSRGNSLCHQRIFRSFTNITVLSLSLDLNDYIQIQIPQDLIMPSVKTLSIKFEQPPTSWAFVSRVAWVLKEDPLQSVMRMCPMMEYLDLDGAAPILFLNLFETSAPGRPTIPTQLSGLRFNGVNFIISQPSRRLLNSLAALQITMLKIDFYGMDNNLGLPPPSIPALQKFLGAFAPTLKHLKLHRIPAANWEIGATESVLKFPEMPIMETLEITHLSVPFFKFTFGDGSAQGIDYMKQFPILKKFHMKSVNVVDDGLCVDGSLLLCEMFFPEGTLPCPTLTRVDVDCISNIKHDDNCKKDEGYCFCKKEGPVWNMFKRLITMFPNVEEFKKCGGWQW